MSARPEDVRSALGASRSFAVRAEPHGPFGILQLQRELVTRLHTNGRPGRPSDPERTLRRLVSFRPDTWEALTEMAMQLSTSDRRVSPGQIAATLIEDSVTNLRAANGSKHGTGHASDLSRGAFLSALQEKRKVRVSFKRSDGTVVTRLTAPLDLGPVRKERGNPVRFQFWDYEGKPQHWLKLAEDNVLEIERTEETFDPSEFVTWNLADSPWSIPRDWGDYS